MIEDRVALGVRRLSIIDVEGGWQPLHNEDQTITVVANAEIYNYVELRSELVRRGHRFATRSDCETIAHLYEEDGEDCVHRLRGMFAFALWDAKHARLLLARDRLGEKPLYIHRTEHGLGFASEMKALLAGGGVPRDLDPTGLNLFFHYSYVPEPRTILKAVRKLPAGHLLTVETKDWRISERRYWTLEDAPPLPGVTPASAIRDELERVAEIIVRADVAVGVSLSGGLDSSVVATLLSQRYPGTIEAFTVGYEGRPENDEREHAAALAHELRMPFHEVELSLSDVVEHFPRLVFETDDPVADIAGSGYRALVRCVAERGIRVLFQGHGGDELFWGYPWLRRALDESRRKAALPDSSWRSAAAYLNFARPTDFSARAVRNWLRRVGGLSSGWEEFRRARAAGSERLIFYELVQDFEHARTDMQRLYSEVYRSLTRPEDATGVFATVDNAVDPGVALTALICSTYLLGNGITQGDRLSMASSVELRLPLVDYRLAETVIGLRKASRDDDLEPKAWFREAVEGIVSPEVLRRPKRGFTPPVRQWYGALFDRFGADLIDGFLVGQGVLSSSAGRELAAGPIPPGSTMPIAFKALVLEQWCRAMLATDPA